jgi:hypothetical protein
MECPKCHRQFRDAYNLSRHEKRANSCAPIITVVNQKNTCRYCGRAFASVQSMNRHIRQYCKIANSDEGMEKLLDHTLQRQLAEQSAKIDELTLMIKQLTMGQLAVAAPAAQQIAQQVEHAQQVNNGTVTNNTVVNINAWDGDRRIGVDIGHIVSAFADNAKLREYAKLSDHELTDPDIAPPYVTELLMDLTKRAHADPAVRNVYLNPRRADQVLVHKKSGAWEVLPLAEATRLLFDGVAATIHHAVMTDAERRQLPLEAQNALSIAGMLYEDEPEEYAKRAKAPMSAHLVNTVPASVSAMALT